MIHWIADSYTLTWVNSVMLLLFVRFHSWRKVKSVSKKINRFVYICTIFALEIFPFLYYPLIFFSSHWLYGINIDIVSHSCALSHRVNLTFIWSWQKMPPSIFHNIFLLLRTYIHSFFFFSSNFDLVSMETCWRIKWNRHWCF